MSNMHILYNLTTNLMVIKVQHTSCDNGRDWLWQDKINSLHVRSSSIWEWSSDDVNDEGDL